MKKLLILLIILGLIVVGGAFWASQPRHPRLTPDTLTFATVEFGTLQETVSASGTLQPRELLVVDSELSGVVVELNARVNDTLPEDGVLAKLDQRQMKFKVDEARNGIDSAVAAVTQAEALAEGAQIALKYQIALEKTGGFRSERDEAEAKLRAAKAGVTVARTRLQAAQTQLKEAERTFDQTVIRIPPARSKSPTSGSQPRQYHVLERKLQLGQFVGPQSGPLFTLAGDPRLMEVHAEMAEGDVGRVRKGQPAVFTVAAYWEPDIKFRGTVTDIRPLPTNVKGAVFYNTVIEVINERDPDTNEWRLRPGMTAAVDVIRREHRQRWKMPTAALNFQLDAAYQSDAAKTRQEEWQHRKDTAQWKTVWVWEEQRQAPWPIFVRVGGLREGEPGIKDGEFNEVLEWEPGREPAHPHAAPRVITDAPAAATPGFLEQPSKLKVS